MALIDVKSEWYRLNAQRGPEKTIAFDGSAGNGATGTVDLFTVTGDVLVKVYAVCTEALAGATATIELGTAGTINGIIVQTTATDIDAGELWHDASPAMGVEAETVVAEFIVVNSADIIATIATANITGGTIRFMCLWKPLSKNAAIVAA